jgi:repressor of nif and glnA expression
MSYQELEQAEGAILNVLHESDQPATPESIVKSLGEKGIGTESIREAMGHLMECHKVDLTKDWKIALV